MSPVNSSTSGSSVVMLNGSFANSLRFRTKTLHCPSARWPRIGRPVSVCLEGRTGALYRPQRSDGGKADIGIRAAMSAYDPTRTIARCRHPRMVTVGLNALIFRFGAVVSECWRETVFDIKMTEFPGDRRKFV